MKRLLFVCIVASAGCAHEQPKPYSLKDDPEFKRLEEKIDATNRRLDAKIEVLSQPIEQVPAEPGF